MRKIKVTLLKPQDAVESPEQIFSSRWSRLHAFLLSVQRALSAPGAGQAAGARGHGAAAQQGPSYEEMYNDVVDICSQRQSSELYARLCACIAERAASLLDALPVQQQGADAAAFLGHLRGAWGVFCSELALQRSIFQHLDRSHVALLPGRARSLWDVGVAQWGEALSARWQALVARAVDCLCREVERERGGEQVDKRCLLAITRMMEAVGLFSQHCAPALLEGTAHFYEAEGHRLMHALDVEAYLRNAEQRIIEECGRCAAYLSVEAAAAGGATSAAGGGGGGGGGGGKGFQAALLGFLEEGLLVRHASALVERGLAPLLRASCTKELRLMYSLFQRINRVDAVRLQFSDFVKVRTPLFFFLRWGVALPSPPSPPHHTHSFTYQLHHAWNVVFALG